MAKRDPTAATRFHDRGLVRAVRLFFGEEVRPPHTETTRRRVSEADARTRLPPAPRCGESVAATREVHRTERDFAICDSTEPGADEGRPYRRQPRTLDHHCFNVRTSVAPRTVVHTRTFGGRQTLEASLGGGQRCGRQRLARVQAEQCC